MEKQLQSMIPILNVDNDQRSIMLAENLGIPHITSQDLISDLYLKYDAEGLALYSKADKHSRPVRVDFLNAQLQRRIERTCLLKEQIIKAVYPKGRREISCWDLTAGFGTDGFIIAAMGGPTCLIERNPIVYALLQDGISRLNEYQHGLTINLFYKDAIEFMQQNLDTPDVIYLDPMHPKRRSADVNRALSLLQSFISEDDKMAALLLQARQKARERVVVKWPLKAASKLPDANYSYKGKSIRFDVYLPT